MNLARCFEQHGGYTLHTPSINDKPLSTVDRHHHHICRSRSPTALVSNPDPDPDPVQVPYPSQLIPHRPSLPSPFLPLPALSSLPLCLADKAPGHPPAQTDGPRTTARACRRTRFAHPDDVVPP
jgi:hypothetical protein